MLSQIKSSRMPSAVYRMFDTEGHLLYVGSSVNVLGRIQAHGPEKSWYRRVVRVEIEHHPTRGAAYNAESHAIETERPEFNRYRVHHRDDEGRAAVATYICGGAA